jgi:MFS transporter, DHA1 family, multidrug resistance protein
LNSWERQIRALVIVQALTATAFSFALPFLPLYIQQIGVGGAGNVEFWSGLIISVQALSMMVFSPIWGSVADKFGRKPMLVRATFAGSVLLCTMGMVGNVFQLLVICGIQGALTGTVSATNALASSIAPREKSGAVMGKLQMARSVGTLGGPVLGGLVGGIVGFSPCFFVTGALLFVSGLVVALVVKEEFHSSPKLGKDGVLKDYLWFIKLPSIGSIFSISFLNNFGRTIIVPVAPLLLATVISQSKTATMLTGLMVSLRALSSIGGAKVMGMLGDQFGHWRTTMVSTLISIVIMIPQPFVTSGIEFVVLQMMAGFATGGLLTTLSAMLNISSPKSSKGIAFGLDNSVGSAARTVAPMLAAFVGSYLDIRVVFVIPIFVYLIIFVLSFRIKNHTVIFEDMPQDSDSAPKI